MWTLPYFPKSLELSGPAQPTWDLFPRQILSLAKNFMYVIIKYDRTKKII